MKSYSFKHSLIDLAVGSAAVGICVMVSVCFRCATVLALVLSLALTITAGKYSSKCPARESDLSIFSIDSSCAFSACSCEGGRV